MKVFFRHDEPRPEQKKLMQDIAQVLEEKKHLVAHAPTGLGKTDAVLSPALSYALENDKTVFFLTPKISQHKIAIEVLQGLAQQHDLDFTATDIVGKKHLCNNMGIKDADSEDFYELCRKSKKEGICPHYGYARGYSINQKALADKNFDELVKWYGNAKTCMDVFEYCESFRETLMPKVPCTYEMTIRLAEKSRVIVGDYYHILNPHISDSILRQTKKSLENSVVIIDEAHNAPTRMRNAMSVSIDTFTLKRAQKEARYFNNTFIEDELNKAEETLTELGEKIRKNEELIQLEDFPPLLPPTLAEIHEIGIDYIENTKKTNSACLKVNNFFMQWPQDSIAFMRLIKKWSAKEGYSINYKCLDPSVVTAELLEQTNSTILMSGTLKPQEMFRDLLGLKKERTLLKEYTNPFPKENRLCLLVNDVTTKYDRRTEEEFDSIAEHIISIVNNTPGNTAVFFPSYTILNTCKKIIDKRLNKKIMIQQPKSKMYESKQMLKEFIKSAQEGAVLLGVAGGSFAEGIDLPGKELLCVVVVGVPLSEPDLETNALINYYEQKYGKGWDYGYIFPAMNRAIQAAGRCIRKETDRGIRAFIDNRFSLRKYGRCFPHDYDFTVTDSPGIFVKDFWKGEL